MKINLYNETAWTVFLMVFMLSVVIVSGILIKRQMERQEIVQEKVDEELFKMSFPLDKYYEEPLFKEVERDESCFICKGKQGLRAKP